MPDQEPSGCGADERILTRRAHAAAAAAVALVCAACASSSGDGAGDAAAPSKDGGGTSADGEAIVGDGGPAACDGCGGQGADGPAGCDGCSGQGDGGQGGPDATSDSGGRATAGSVLTYHDDNGRTGQNLDETVLTPANVNKATFGKKFAQPVDGYVYAQPLFVPALGIGGQTHDVVFVVTEDNGVYAFDANTKGPVLWHTNVGTALSCSDLNDCGDLVPGAGITGTPVIDATTQTMYLVALSKDSVGFHHRLHAIDLTTGADKLGGPVEISPTAAGTGQNSQNGVVRFDPATHYQRAALLLTGGVVYIGIGSNAESNSDNHGWIVGYRASDLSLTMTFCTSPDDNWSSIWQSGGGLASDQAGSIYAETANGTFDVDTGGSDYGDSAIKLDSKGAVLDYFTPYNQAALSSADIDFGAANPLLLPDQTGPVSHELIASGKPGILYLVNRDGMGHFHSGSDSQIVQSVKAFPNTTGILNGIFMSPAYWNGRVFVA
ncbi:MAG: pyrrolo-quinoline quinone, partial [Acidimicrobiales bacterium]